MRKSRAGIGKRGEIILLVLVIRVLGGCWVNAMSFKNYFRGSH